MAATTYQYSVPNDFPNQKVDVPRLTQEIQESSIVTALDHITVYGPDVPPQPWCDVVFKDPLSAGDQTTLDGLVAVHSGEPLPNVQPVVPSDTDGDPLPQPKYEADHRQVVVNFPGTEGTMLWIAGAGDDLNPTPPSSGRGEGQKILVEFTDAGTEEVECVFSEWIELHDGRLFNTPVDAWTPEDRWSFYVRCPATPVVASPTWSGNCFVVDEQGNPGDPDATHYIIVPAAGNGNYDVDLNTAVPVPAGLAQNGYWDVDKLTEVITPSLTPGAAEWLLLTVQVDSFFMKNIPLGNPLGVFDFDAYKAEWVSSKWALRLKVERVSTGAGTVAGWLVMFRQHST
jgi:hypothetical protein